MKNEQFDRIVSEIRNAHAGDDVVAGAGERVWNSLAETPAGDTLPQTLRACSDFQALIPAYLSKQLTAARHLLFEDHVHACVGCRRALEAARGGERQRVWQVESVRPRSAGWRWAISVASLVLIGFAVFAFRQRILPAEGQVRGAVQSVQGSVYAVAGEQMRLVPAGYQIKNNEEIRTAKMSTAVLRLADGSSVEMGERADLSLSGGWTGTTIRLDGGQVIVQAARQRTGSHLYVATDEGLVSVKGTIFSVNHGIKGSRVAVIEGVVRVDYGGQATELHAGEQATSGANVAKVPIRNEIAWSRNAGKYLALLGDFSVLQEQFAAIPGPGLRYSSDLLPYLPDNTVVFASIPNLANTLREANRLFQDRLQQSPALREWWRQQQKGKGPKLEDVLDQLKTFSSYLGDEIVFAVDKLGPNASEPLVLAQVRQSGLESFLENENQRLAATPSRAALQVVRNPWAVTPKPGGPLLVYVNNGLLIASPDLTELRRAVNRAQQGTSSSFAQRPFYQQIVAAYQQGAEWLLCADMEQIVAQNVHMASGRAGLPPGMEDVRYLTMEHREVSGKTENRAALSFASDRHGIASWLAAPAPMGSLEFVSPDATMVTSAVIKNPRTIMQEILQIGSRDPDFNQHLSDVEAKTGVDVVNDLAAPLGGEVTMAFDGPVLPTPSWKLIVEVYDPATLQSTITKLVDSINREISSRGESLQLTSRQVGSQTYFTISNPKHAGELDYTFADSYLVAGPDIGTLSRAIQTRQAGYTLTHSSTFQALLPNDGYTNFSGVFYHNLGPVVGPLADQLRSSGTLTPQQRQSIDALLANSAPGLIYAYGEPDRIVVASNTGFMGFDLGTLLTMGDNGPFLPQIILGKGLGHPAP